MRTLPAALLLALSGCSSGAPASAPDGGAAGLVGGAGAGGGPIRTSTTRGLLGTSPRNLLLDPFVTSDGSWGHFVGVLLPAGSSAPKVATFRRAYVSQSPAGVAVPVAVVAALASVAPSSTALQLVAPFPGGSDAFEARVWVSAGDVAGKPVAFDTVADRVTVALLPNDQPSQTFPLAPAGAPVVLAGRPWVALSLPSPVPVPQGGWFSILLHDAHLSLQIQAPEVTPAAMAGPHPLPATTARTARDRAAPGAYVEITRRGL